MGELTYPLDVLATLDDFLACLPLDETFSQPSSSKKIHMIYSIQGHTSEHTSTSIYTLFYNCISGQIAST